MEIHSSLLEVCGVETVDRSTISRWSQRFREGRLSIENDPKSGQPRTSTDDQSVECVHQILEEDRRMTCKETAHVLEFHEHLPTVFWLNACTNVELPPSGLILHDNTRPHASKVVRQLLDRYSWEVLLHPPYSPDTSPPDFDLFPKLKINMRGVCFSMLEDLSACVTWHVRQFNCSTDLTGIIDLPKRSDAINRQKGSTLKDYNTFLHIWCSIL